MTDDRHWLQVFIQDNAWSILVLVVGMSVFYATISARVQANEDKIKNIEQTQIVIVENQKSILELQVNHAHLTETVNEIKADVKTLLRRE